MANHPFLRNTITSLCNSCQRSNIVEFRKLIKERRKKLSIFGRKWLDDPNESPLYGLAAKGMEVQILTIKNGVGRQMGVTLPRYT